MAQQAFRLSLDLFVKRLLSCDLDQIPGIVPALDVILSKARGAKIVPEDAVFADSEFTAFVEDVSGKRSAEDAEQAIREILRTKLASKNIATELLEGL